MLRKNLLNVSKIGTIIFVLFFNTNAVCTAANSYDAEFTNGSIANALDGAVGKYLLTKTVQDFGYSIYQQGRNYDSGQEWVSSSPDQDFVNRHAYGYCSPNIDAEVKGFACKRSNSVSDADWPYVELGDLNFASVLDPIQYDTVLNTVAQNLIRNIVSPFPPSTYKTNIVDPNFMQGGGRKKTDYANFLAGQAVSGVALYALNTIYGMRVVGSDLGLSGNDANSPSKFSFMAVIEKEATRRFTGADNGAFAAFLNDPATDQTKLLKEIAAMEAFRLYMDYQSFRQMERMEALIAASLAKMVNDSYSNSAMLGGATSSATTAH